MTPQIKQRIEQIRRGEVPKGYKRTKIGVVLSEWEETRLSRYLVVNSDKNISLQYGKEDVFSISGELGLVNQIELLGRSYAGVSVAPYGIVYPNNVVYTKSPLKANPYGVIKTNKTGKTGIVSTLYAIFRCNDNVCPDFVQTYFELDQNLNNYLYPIVNIGAKHDMKISDENSLKGWVVFPSLDEQKKIAEILSAQNKLIALKEKLVEEKKRQKKALMQQLITGKKRLPGFSEDRVSLRLKQVAERITRKNAIANNNVLTISAQYGLINQFEFFDKEIASEDKSNYYLLMQNEFAYNKSYSANYPFGAIKKLTRYDMGIVSPLYICFRIVGNEVSTEYMEHYFEAGLMNSEIQSFAQEGARNHGLLNISVEDFFQSKIVIPPYEEQIAIAKILSSIAQEIDLLQQTLEQEKRKKKALMQLLLTGIVRV